jgi:hypothetical protein
MSQTVHMSIDIRGVLNWPKRRIAGLFKHSDGRRASADEVRDHLHDMLSEGKRCLPFGKPCEGFSYETGCPGHSVDDGKNTREIQP